jgi:putative RecB family exonuclease
MSANEPSEINPFALDDADFSFNSESDAETPAEVFKPGRAHPVSTRKTRVSKKETKTARTAAGHPLRPEGQTQVTPFYPAPESAQTTSVSHKPEPTQQPGAPKTVGRPAGPLALPGAVTAAPISQLLPSRITPTSPDAPVERVRMPLSQLLPERLADLDRPYKRPTPSTAATKAAGRPGGDKTPQAPQAPAEHSDVAGKPDVPSSESAQTPVQSPAQQPTTKTVAPAPKKQSAPQSSATPRPRQRSRKAASGSAMAAGWRPGPGDAQIPEGGSLPMLPTRLSPSRAKDFKQCPRLFFYKTILRLPGPPTVATAKGTVAHAALEMLFSHPRAERTTQVALAYVLPAWTVLTNPSAEMSQVDDEFEVRLRVHWKAHVGGDVDDRSLLRAEEYLQLAPPASATEGEIISGAQAAVLGYFTMENPQAFDPVSSEMTVQGVVGEADQAGQIHGIIDRVDEYIARDGSRRVIISDFKTGKVPQDQYLKEAFFAMRAYALMYRQEFGITPHQLRLLYVADAKGPASIRSEYVDDSVIERTEVEFADIWARIKGAARTETWEPTPGPLCPWCPFAALCPAFATDVKPVTDAQDEDQST